MAVWESLPGRIYRRELRPVPQKLSRTRGLETKWQNMMSWDGPWVKARSGKKEEYRH
jgi:hypothetical protein